MIHWREKLVATAVHFMITLLLAGVAAALIFLVWFPDPFREMIGGTKLFLLIAGSDLALGPLISLVIYNSRKARRVLLTDYTIIGMVQLAALLYGVSIMADARPAYVAFSLDRFEIVLAGDLMAKERAAARNPRYARVPLTGPEYVGVVVPQADHDDALFEALSGNEEHLRPKFYVPYETQLEGIRKRSKTLAELEKKRPDAAPLIRKALADVAPGKELRWLPVRHFRGFWTAIVDTADGKPVAFVDIDPY